MSDRRAVRAEAARVRRESMGAADGRCEVCGWHIKVHVHHVVPVWQGGGNEPDNLVVLCPNHHAMAHALCERDGRSFPVGRHALIRLINANRHTEAA
jgi:5-methylcytosine-specific restriction endonuclease McrA